MQAYLEEIAIYHGESTVREAKANKAETDLAQMMKDNMQEMREGWMKDEQQKN